MDRKLRRIGYWVSKVDPSLPNPVDLIVSIPGDDAEFLIDYLGRGFVARAYLGRSTCRICGQSIGSLELSDGTYLWPEGLAHYVSAHSVAVPKQFLDHARRFSEDLEDAVADDEWWKSHYSEV
jgi:hypothetical protein